MKRYIGATIVLKSPVVFKSTDTLNPGEFVHYGDHLEVLRESAGKVFVHEIPVSNVSEIIYEKGPLHDGVSPEEGRLDPQGASDVPPTAKKSAGRPRKKGGHSKPRAWSSKSGASTGSEAK